MDINSNYNNYYDQMLMNNIEDITRKVSSNKNILNREDITLNNNESAEEKELRSLANEFTSILMKQMFKSMRSTIPEGELMDGGFSEDVFTDMLDGEISKLGAGQKGFSNLGRMLYEQLRTKMGV